MTKHKKREPAWPSKKQVKFAGLLFFGCRSERLSVSRPWVNISIAGAFWPTISSVKNSTRLDLQRFSCGYAFFKRLAQARGQARRAADSCVGIFVVGALYRSDGSSSLRTQFLR